MKKLRCLIGMLLMTTSVCQAQINEKDTMISTVLAQKGSVQLQADILPDYVDLNWTKGPDEFIGYFELYRSADGMAYHFVKQFRPKTFDASERSFNYRDEDPLRGKNFYRLVGYDQHSGEKRTVELVAEYRNQPRKIQPTLIAKGNQLNIQNYDGEELHLWIFTTAGAPIIQKVVASSVVNLGTENLSSGLYVYQLLDRQKLVVSTGKFVLQ
jgi:hypothetical protein